MSRSRLTLLMLALAAVATAPRSAGAVEATVGAYYYPWWSTHNWDATLRARLTPEDHAPVAGYYSETAATISEHINQSHRGNVSLWASSWWGPGSSTDVALREVILTHPRAGELDYAVHYESTGRLRDSNGNDDFTNLVPDFEYLAENVFSDPNYHRIDGRPVVFMYVTRAFFSDPAAQQALSAARDSLQANYGYDPYVVGDEIFGSNFNESRASHFDAVTTFDVYAMSGFNQGESTPSDVATAAAKYSDAADAGATVIPGVTPGYNDKAVRDGNRATGRYFAGETIADAGSVFTSLLDDAAIPHLDESTGNLLLVNSFNEWHEDTQIEATVVAPATATDDSDSGVDLTEGVTYEGYGYKYLDLLRIATTDAAIPLLDGDADFDGDLDDDDILAFAAAWQQEYLVEGVRTGGVASRETLPDFNYDGVVDLDDWFFMRRAHGPADLQAALAQVAAPEPSGGLLVMSVIAAMIAPIRMSGRV